MKKLVHDENISLKEIIYKNTLNLYPIVDAENIIIRNTKDTDLVIKVVLSEIDKNVLQDVANYFHSNEKEVKSFDGFIYDYVCFKLSDENKEVVTMSLTEYLSFAEKENTDIYNNVWEIFEMIEEENLQTLEEEIDNIPQ